jgi:hypothetical protein
LITPKDNYEVEPYNKIHQMLEADD